MAGGRDEALHDRINRKIRDHDVVDISACGIFKVPNPLREINQKAYEPQVISIGPYHHGKEHLKAMEVQKMNSLKSIFGENSVEIYVTELKTMEKKIREFYSENLDHIGGEKLIEMMLLDGFFIIGLSLHCSNALTSFYLGNIMRDLLLVENQLPFSVLSKLISLFVDQTRLLIMDETGRLINAANFFLLGVIRLFGRMVPGLPIIAHVGNQDAKHMLGLLHAKVTRTPQWPPLSATAVSFPWWQPCLACAGRLQFSRWLPCLAQARRPPQLAQMVLMSVQERAGTSEPERAGTSEPRKWCLIRSATELNEAGIKFQKKTGKVFDIEFQKEVMSIPTLIIDDYTESIFRNFVAYEQCYKGISSKPFTDYITFMDSLINTGKDVELLCRCGVLDNWLGDHEVVASMFNRLRDSVLIPEADFFYTEIFNRVNEHCNRKWNLWKANLWHNYFNTPWALISFIAAVILLLSTLLQTLFSILSYRH